MRGHHGLKRVAFSAAAVALVLGAGALAAQERAATEQRIEHGRRMFTEHGCYGCHTVGKYGTPIGPDLSRIGAKHSEAYLRTWLRDPALHRPVANMPQLELSEPQIAALASFLGSLR